jgi:serine/threonine-protein kinase
MSGSDADIERLIGSTVAGKYRIEQLIGRGGMGAVFQATHVGIGKRVALKFLHRDAARDADAVTRFQREAESASAVESTHIVQIFDSGVEDGAPYLVMELLRGEDLRARLKRQGRLEVAEAVQIAGQVLRGLARAHAAGIVHRDLKPDNIYLAERDDELSVKIVDFGISKIQNPATPDNITQRGTILGTAFYMSPEQAQCARDLDGRTDLWSLGAILYECLAARPPHLGAAYEAVLIAICTTDAEDVRVHAPDVAPAVAEVIARALARDREERYQSAEQMYRALAAALPGVLDAKGLGSRSSLPSAADVATRAETPPAALLDHGTGAGTAVRLPGRTEARRNRRRTAVAVLVAALGAFAVTAFVMARRGGGTAAPEPAAARVAAQHTALPQPPQAPQPPAVEAAPIVATPPPAPSESAAPVHRPPTRRATVTGRVGESRKAANRSDSSRPQSGVASELELNTRGP